MIRIIKHTKCMYCGSDFLVRVSYDNIEIIKNCKCGKCQN